MGYQVELAERAENDIEEAFAFIRNRAPLNAVRWRRALEAKLDLLQRMPNAFALAPENQDWIGEVRQLLFGQYRILYTIVESTVYVLTVRHGARQLLTSRKLQALLRQTTQQDDPPYRPIDHLTD